MRRAIDRASREGGQAAVELVAAAPLIAVVGLVGWQIVLAGHTWWKLGEAARISAREMYVATARGERNAGVRRSREIAKVVAGRDARFSVGRDGAVEVERPLPLIQPFAGLADGPVISRTIGFVR